MFITRFTSRALLSLLLLLPASVLLGQTQHNIQFNGNGIMTAPPPLVVRAKDKLTFTINFDRVYFDKKIKDAIEMYMTAIDNLRNDKEYGYIDASVDPINEVICALGSRINDVKAYLSTDEQALITQRLTAYAFDTKCNAAVTVPDLNLLIKPVFAVDIYYYDKLNNQIGTDHIAIDQPSGAIPNNYSVCSLVQTIAATVTSVRFELRETNLLNQLIVAQVAGSNIITQQNLLTRALQQIKLNLTPQVMTNYSALQKLADDGKKFLGGDHTIAVDAAWITAANAANTGVKTEAEKNIKLLQSRNIKNWFLRWMWLTKGLPKTNPFDFQAQPLIAGTGTGAPAKVTEKEKALAGMYDDLVTKGAFRLNSAATLSKDLDAIADIKARMKAEAAAGQTATSSDTYWYKGLMYVSPDYTFHLPVCTEESDYMISHDAANQYTMMTKPVKEVTEMDRVFVFAQNKKPGDYLKIDVTATPITDDVSKTTQELNLSYLHDAAIAGGNLQQQVYQFLADYDLVNKEMTFVVSLNAAPKLPVQFSKSTTVVYQTENQVYNNNFAGPTPPEYTLSTGSADKPVVAYKGTFRVNKLYNLRFKAGMIYSGLDKTTYTKKPDNSYSASADKSGVDGIFGIQIFPFKTDIRSVNILKGRASPYLFAGFSMKDIANNFYPTVGLEIFSGIAVGYTRHYGKTSVLTGFNGVPQQINSKWASSDAVCFLVDLELFTNLFKITSNKSLLGF